MLENKLVQVRKMTISQNIVQQLIQLIMNGSIPAGHKLPNEKQLMDLFGVGRSSLREAIRALAALGLVEVRVPEGTFVSNDFGDFFTKHLAIAAGVSFKNIVELIEARIAVETDIAELAAIKAKQEDCSSLYEVIDSMKVAQDNESFLQADLKFHTLLAEISRNSFMMNVLKILSGITSEWISKVIQLNHSKELAIEQHLLIAAAVEKQDPENAGKAMTAHLHSVSDLLMKVEKGEVPTF